jgi:hypothetical protein
MPPCRSSLLDWLAAHDIDDRETPTERKGSIMSDTPQRLTTAFGNPVPKGN